MAVILDPELKALMAQDRSGAVLWQDEAGRTALLAKAADADVESFRGQVSIQSRWEMGRLACGSVLRLHLTIFDRPVNPYRFETFINVGAAEQRACVEQLLTQETMQLHFFDSRTEHALSKQIVTPDWQRRKLGGLIRQAVQNWNELGEDWDFDQAKALFQATQSL